jgi:hypothetical protein
MLARFNIVFRTIIICFLLSGNIFTQVDTSEAETEEIIEKLLEETDSENNDDLLERIEEIKQNPLDLNSVSLNDLLRIPFLNLNTAQLIIDQRDRFGYYYSINELNMIENLDHELIKKIIPFLYASKKITINENTNDISSDNYYMNKTRLQFRTRIKSVLQPNSGFLEKKYFGNKLNNYSRILLDYGKIFSTSFIIEKDPGEKSLSDFYSFNLVVKNLYGFDKILVGDYNVEFGQGLALWSPYSFGKGGDISGPINKRNRNIVQYKSTDENRFFRGLALSYLITNWRVSLFFSKNNFDASMDTVLGDYTSISLDGYHRTDDELNKKNIGEEKFFGARIDYKIRNIQIGFLAYQSSFNKQFFRKSLYDLAGDRFDFYSFSYDYILNNFNFSGEIAYNKKSVASINSVQIALSDKITFVTLIRSYPRNYIPLHSFGFGENSGATQNEFGIYTGLEWKTIIGKLNIYGDFFSFPSSTYFIDLPSNGSEYYIDLTSKISNQVESYLRYKNETKDVNASLVERKIVAQRERQSIRGDIVYNVSKDIRIKSRVEFNTIKIVETNSFEKGFLVFQDLKMSIVKNFNVYSRFIFYQTDSFNSAVYEFENDVEGVLSNFAMYGEGMRWYLLLKYKLMNKIEISFKYSETYKPKEKTLSSGDSEIFNNLDNRFNLQIELNL